MGYFEHMHIALLIGIYILITTVVVFTYGYVI